MLDETNPADTTASMASTEETPAAASPAKKAPAKKAAAKKAPAKKAAAKKAAAKKSASPEVPDAAVEALAVATDAPAPDADAPVAKKVAARRTRKAPAKKVAPDTAVAPVESPAPESPAPESPAADVPDSTGPVKKAAARKAPAKKAAAKKAPAKNTVAKKAAASSAETETLATATAGAGLAEGDSAAETLPLFQTPDAVKKAPARRTRKRAAAPVVESPVEKTEEELAEEAAAAAALATGTAVPTANDSDGDAVAAAEADHYSDDSEAGDSEAGDSDADDSDDGTPSRRRRRRGGRRRRKPAGGGDQDTDDADESGDSAPDTTSESGEEKPEDADDEDSSDNADGESGSSSSRRRRRRRRSGDGDSETADDPENTVVRVRKTRSAEDQITAVAGSTRLEAKKQRRREGREAGRRRAPIVSEAEFLARREAVDRVMVVRQRADLTQIAVLEDKVLVEHYVARESQTSLIGNVYLGRVQNVLPSMEAAFVDIGKGRNAVIYAGEVNWSALGHKEGQQRKIESVLSPGQPILVQVTKDPIGNKGARLTSQISLAGRFLVYVPDGTTSGISRKLPDTERSRLKSLLKEIVPDSAGVIVRTAAEGATEDELTRDVERLKARWEDIDSKARGNGPQLLYGEPDLTLKVVRDLFTEDFAKLVIEGDDAWQTVSDYVEHVAPDLAERLERYAPADAASAQQGDVFSVYRIDEQIAKGLDRKVWLPSGGSLVIDRTEAMTVVDVNTGKFTGSGGNLEETVTKNNLEAAEEIVRQLRLRDIGGIIVVDFIDMVLESNRDLVVRRMVECLGRDRTRHQVAEVTSLGLVQMTRKRIGTGLLESFSSECQHCQGRGVITHAQPIEQKSGGDDDGRGGGRRGRGRGREDGNQSGNQSGKGSAREGGRGRGGEKKSDEQSGSQKSGAQKSGAQNSGAQNSGAQNSGAQNSGAQNSGAHTSGSQNSTPSPKDVAAKARPEEPVSAAPASPEAVSPEAVSPEAASTGAASTGAASTETAPAAEVPAIQVTTTTRRSSRSRGRQGAEGQGAASSRGRGETPAASPVNAGSTSPQQDSVPAVEPVVAPVSEPASVQVDAAPKVITRTRRGGASRSTTTSGTAVTVTVAPTAPETAEVKNVVETPEGAKPKVITRTRGRAEKPAAERVSVKNKEPSER